MGPRPSASELRLLVELAARYGRELLRIGRGARDFADTLIQAEVLHANAARLRGDLRLQQMYATFYAPPPDKLRRAAQAPTLARNLGLPLETVRRRVRRLAADGVFDLNRRGVLFSQRALRSAAHRVLLEEVYDLTRELYGRLQQAGLISPMALPAPRTGMPSPAAPPLRIVLRQAADSFIEVGRAFAGIAGGVPEGFILMDVVAEASGPRRPRNAAEVAHDLGLSVESVRRRLAELNALGLCAEGDGGLMPGRALAADALEALGADCHAALAGLFAALSEVGVLTLWDAEAEAAARAA